MEKIKQKPIENLKTVIIAILTVTMLALAAIYIGGSQFSKGSAAINAGEMPPAAVAVGESAPKQVYVYEKNLLGVSYIGIRFGNEGGGAYATEQAAGDLLDFSLDGIHTLLSSAAQIRESSQEEFENAISENRYICMSLISPLPYQIIYTLSGEYISPLGSSTAISPEALTLAFKNDGGTALYMSEGKSYYVCEGEYTVKASEILAMASDTRLLDFEIVDGLPVSEASPLVQTLSLGIPQNATADKIYKILSLLGYNAQETPMMATTDTFNTVAPHGTLLLNGDRIVYTASTDGGISLAEYLNSSKSELDIDMQDVLLASVSLAESLAEITETDNSDIYLDGFYKNDDIYTAVFGICNNGIPISGDAFPHLARITVQGGRLRSVEFCPLTVEKSGLSFSPFSSAWEYRYASKNADISSIGLRYNVKELPASELHAAWYYTEGRVAR